MRNGKDVYLVLLFRAFRSIGQQQRYCICRETAQSLQFVLHTGQGPESEFIVGNEIEIHAAQASEAP